jgi:heme-degrading monooxygenase HmoA
MTIRTLDTGHADRPGLVSVTALRQGDGEMYLLIVAHEVEDFDRFTAVFDAHPPSHGGAASHRVSRNVDDPNSITIVAAFDSLDDARAWRDNPELRTAFAGAGIVGVPRVEIHEEVGAWAR